MVNVLVNGIGAIGKRVAVAVRKQDDMILIGISDIAPTFILRTLTEPGADLYGVDVYCSGEGFIKNFEEGGFYVKGTLKELLKSGKVDVVVDCTPEGIEKNNKPMYEETGVKVVYQGGADAEITDMSFSPFVNYEKAIGKKSARVVSCNTTSIIRTVNIIDEMFSIKEATVSLVRRAVDPWNHKKGPINSIEPVTTVPSHHGPDVNTVMKNLNIKTMAVKVPTTLAHVHMVHVKTEKYADRNRVIEIFSKHPRIKLLKASQGYESTAQVMERYRDTKMRGDMMDVMIWEESINTEGENIYWMHAVHSESIVIPETIDAIRAISGIEKNSAKSVEKTDKSLGIFRE